MLSYRSATVHKLGYSRQFYLCFSDQNVRFSPPPKRRTFRDDRSISAERSVTRRILHGVVTDLAFLGRPTIGFGARAAHQHLSFTIAQAISLEEGFDGLVVVDDGVCACPVRAPQAAVETPSIEHAGERIPNVRERIRFPGQRAGAAHLDHRVLSFGQVQHLRQVGPRLQRGWWGAGLQDSQMVDDETCIGVAVDQRRARIHVAPAQYVDRKIVLYGRAQDAVEARVIRLAVLSFVIMMRMPTAPGVCFQSAMISPTAGSSGSTGLTIANRPGWARCTSTA